MARIKKYHKRYPTRPYARAALNIAKRGALYLGKQYLRSKMRSVATQTAPKSNEKIDHVTAQKDYARIHLHAKKYKRVPRKFKLNVRRVVQGNVSRVLSKTGWANASCFQADLDSIRQGTLPYGQIGRQSIMQLAMCTFSKSNLNQNYDDINEMLAAINGNEAVVQDREERVGVFIKSSLWELILRNFGDNPMYCDIYHWKCRRHSSSDPIDFVSAMDAQIDTATPSGGTNYITSPIGSDYGWTPYQNPELMKHIKIYRKERYLIPAGEIVQVEKRIGIYRTFTKNQLASNSLDSVQNKIHAGITHGLFIISYGVPQNLVEPNNNVVTGTHRLHVSWNKTIYFDKATYDNINRSIEWRTYQ